jgi:hypothetical protein
MQMYRGAVQSKMVASKAALQSLESVSMSKLADNERSKLQSHLSACFFFLRRIWKNWLTMYIIVSLYDMLQRVR